MCLDSREFATREIRVGEQAFIGPCLTSSGRQVTLAKPLVPRGGIEALCIKDGFQLRFKNLPLDFVDAHALAGPRANATFREGQINARADQVEFDNGEVVRFDSIPWNTRLVCTGYRVQPRPIKPARDEPIHQIVQGAERRLPVQAGFLATVRSDPRVGVGAGVLALFVAVGSTLF